MLSTFEGKTEESIARKARNTRAFFEHHLREFAEEHAEFERLFDRHARWT